MLIELLSAQRSDAPTLANLFELYLHDFSEITGGDPGDDGRFGYPRLSAYWTEPHRSPFLIRADHRLAGFALACRGSVITGAPDVMDVAEFFVVRSRRRKGVGVEAARLLFGCFPGVWEIRAMVVNEPAVRFWRQVVTVLAPRAPEEFDWRSPTGTEWRVFRFRTTG